MSLQQQLDARGTVAFSAAVDLSAPLVIGARTHLDGGGLGSLRAAPGYAGPLVVSRMDEHAYWWSVKRTTLVGGGIRLPKRAPRGPAPAFFAIEDVQIVNAKGWAFDDDGSAAWMGTVKRVWVAGGEHGFRKAGGTTTLFENCHVSGNTGRAWDLSAVYASELRGCAMDHQRAKLRAAASFRDCRGLVLSAWDMENNDVDEGPLVEFLGCDGLQVQAFWSVGNRLHAPAQSAAYLVHLGSSTGTLNGMSVGGGERPTPDTADGDPTGHTATVIVTGDSRLTIDGCTIAPARKLVTAQREAFSLVGNLQQVEVRGSRIVPHVGPGQRDPHVKEAA